MSSKVFGVLGVFGGWVCGCLRQLLDVFNGFCVFCLCCLMLSLLGALEVFGVAPVLKVFKGLECFEDVSMFFKNVCRL